MNFIYETERLLLRVLDGSSAKSVCEFYKNNRDTFEAVEPPRIPNFYTEAFHKANLIQEYNETIQGRYLRFFVFEKTNPTKIIGSICFHGFKTGCFQSCTVGYKMDHAYQNLGYMSECLNFSIQQVIAREYSIHRIEALVLPDNSASIHVLEHAGFIREGIARDYAKLNGIWRDHFRYSILVYQ